MDKEINTVMDLGIDSDITTSSLTLPTPLAVAASLITIAVLCLRAILKRFTSNPYIPTLTPGVSVSYALGICAGAVSVLLRPDEVPTAVTKSTCQRMTVVPVITLTVTVEDLPVIVISPPAEAEEDAAGTGVRRWVTGTAEDGDVRVYEENASTSGLSDSVFDANVDVDFDVEYEDEQNKARKHEANDIPSGLAEPLFDADGSVESSENHKDVHGQKTSTSAPADPAFDLFTQLHAIAQSRPAPQTPARTPENSQETSLYSMLASLTPRSPTFPSSTPSSPDTEQPATPSDTDFRGEATTMPTSQSPSSTEKQRKRFKFDFDWSEDVEEEDARRNRSSEVLVVARLPSGSRFQEMLGEELGDAGAY